MLEFVRGGARGGAGGNLATGGDHAGGVRSPSARAIARLQGLFIKIGQLISIMTNFLPEEFRAELEGLQDQVPPRPYAEVEQRFVEEFGKKPRELFAEFDERPIASASIGQVHRASLPSGD